MKRLLSLVLVLALALSFSGVVPASAEEKVITVVVDGEAVNFDVPPQIINDRTMVPVRAIFEALGATVSWNDETKTVTATKEESVVSLTINSNVMKVNDTEKTIDVPAQIVNDRTLVPVRAISEAFECAVEWDQETYTVTITSTEEEILIDFTNDDGTMSVLQYRMRYGFEQEYLPGTVYANEELIAELIKEDPEQLVAIIDDQIWGAYRDALLVTYMEESEETFVIESVEHLYEVLSQLADEFYLRAYQAYSAEYLMLDDTKYCLILCMNEVADYLMLDEMFKLLLSSHVAIVYDDATGEISYFTLEKSIENMYMLCTVTSDGTHRNFGIVENNTDAFIEAITTVLGE